MKEYRCTRITPRGIPYPVRSAAYKEPAARQGHYIRAEDDKQALLKMQENFPEDVRDKDLGLTFTVAFHRDLSHLSRTTIIPTPAESGVHLVNQGPR